MNDIDRLRQLRVASYTGRMPPDLALWAVDIVEAALPHVMRVRQRNDFLQQAADLLPSTTSARSTAAAISDGLRSVSRGGCGTAFEEGTFERYLQCALECDPRTPTSCRHIMRLLDV